jgi:hypothetical protein
MSLVDALLLDPHRDPREIWIAARTDGQRGDGSQADPYNGSSIPYPTIPITQITLTKDSDPYEATAITDGPHGFCEGDMVSVAGGEVITDPNNNYAGFANVNYHGTFRIKSVGSTHFTYQMLGRPYHTTAQASALNPLACWREREQFDVVMRSLSPNSTIHLGPGVFDTKGFAADNTVAGRWTFDAQGNHVVVPGSWAAQSGQRIIGSGIAITTLKLVGATARNSKYAAIGTSNKVNDEGYLDGFQASDFSVDCNAEGQYSPHVACAAIQLQRGGRHVRIRCVRAIRFGSRAPDYYVENFVFYISVPLSDAPGDLIDERRDGHDCVLEDCIAEQRSANVMSGNSILLIGGGDYGVIPYYARGCAIRNCYVNDEIVYGPIVAVEKISYESSNNTATVTTKWPHGHSKPGNLAVRGCGNNAFNGVFAVDGIDSANPETKLTYKPFPNAGPGGDQTGDIYIGGGVSSHTVAVLNPGGIQRLSGKTHELTTINPHKLTVNNAVRISGVRMTGAATPSLIYNGLFTITRVISATKLEFDLPQDPGANPNINYDFPIAIHVPSIATTVAGGTAAVAEGNRILHCGNAGPWQDTFSTLDLVARNNYGHDIHWGPSENLGDVQTHTYVSGTLSSVGKIATFNRGAAHGLSVGDGVFVEDAVVGGSFNNPYNGAFVVESVSPDSPSTWFTYTMAADPGVSPASGTPKSARIWQTRRLIIENNILELTFNAYFPYPYLYGQPAGLWIVGNPAFPPVYRHLGLVARGNIVRPNSDTPDLSATPFAISLGGIGRGIIESNITSLDSVYPAPFIYNNSGPLHFFNNQTIAGKLEQGFDNVETRQAPDLAANVEAALLLSF